MHDTFESMPSGSGPIAHKVGSVFQRLISSNEEVLHPSHYETRFNYRIKTVSSSQINAFATPGGGLVVFSQLVKEIDSAILNKSIKESTVTFADGSKATVDLSSVKTEDVLAALIGHEMTHAASRHSMIGLVGQLVRSVVFSIGRYAVMSYLKNTDEQYQKLAKIAEHNRTKAEADLLCSKESSFALINNVLCWLEDKIKSLTNLFHSRQNEYEADVTGVYMAKQAGFNPLGALYLQEVLSTSSNPIHKYLEFLFTHPYGENRKRALLSAIHSFDTAYTEGHIKALNISKVYDDTTLSPALMSARQLNFA